MDCIAITDHDTMDGAEAARKIVPSGMRLILGVELSLRDMRGLHLLAYGKKYSTALQAELESLSRGRESRADRMLERLMNLGMPLDREALHRRAAGSLGRPHIAAAMVEAGYVPDIKSAFDNWLGEGKPAYAEAERMSMTEALQLLADTGYVPVLAHPRELGLSDYQLRPLIEKWTGLGLRGMEVYHPSALKDGFAGLLKMAREFGLKITGGSDYHGFANDRCLPGGMAECWTTAEKDLEFLLQE